MGRPLAVLAFLLLLTGCSTFDHGLVDETAPMEAVDGDLAGLWFAEPVRDLPRSDNDTGYLRVVIASSGLITVQVVEKERCHEAETYVGRQVSLAGQRILQLRSDKNADLPYVLFSYQWGEGHELQVEALDDSVLVRAVEEHQLLGEVQSWDTSRWAKISASPLSIQDYLKRRPDAFKPFLTLHRASDFPC